MQASLLFLAAMYALMLLVPGYLVLRCFSFSRAWSLCCASIVTTALVGVVGEVYNVANVATTPLSVYMPLVFVPAIVLVVLRRRHGAEDFRAAAPMLEMAEIAWWMPLLFVVVGVLICKNLFVEGLPSLDAVTQSFDVQHHLNVTRAFYDAQVISSRGVSFYETAADATIRPFGIPSFYPAVWYGQCALLMQATNIATPVALNVGLIVTLALCYPLAMCAFASTVFEHNRKAVLFAAFTCVAFAMFPWCTLLFGPLYPNLVGFGLMPASIAICLVALRGAGSRRGQVLAWTCVLVCLVGQCFLQPNTVFSMFVILVPYAALRVFQIASARGLSRLRAAGMAVAFLCVCLLFWTLCYVSPVFTSVTSEYWAGFAYTWQEVVNILTQTYTLFFFNEITAQLLLGALVIFGFVRSAYDGHVRWIVAAYLLVCAICFLNATDLSEALKRFVSGFWYTDPMRLAAMAIVVAALLAANGLAWVYELVCELLRRYNVSRGRETHTSLVAVVLVVCFMVLNFMPGFNWPGAHAESSGHIEEFRLEGHEYDALTVKTTFGDYRNVFRVYYASSLPVDVNEFAFLAEVAQVVGDDLVINNPYDGSTLAYGVDGIRTYYRKAYGFGGTSETDQSELIRQRLADYASDASVRQAVQDIDARYVLVLSAEYSDQSFVHLRTDLNDGAYDGISSITADTPGFTEVLASGTCHLYRIDD